MLAAGAGRSAQQTRREQLGGEGNEQFVSCSPGTTGVQGRVGVLVELDCSLKDSWFDSWPANTEGL